MSVEARRKIPEAIFMLVSNTPAGPEVRLYQSYTHAWKNRERLGGQLFKIGTAGMMEVRA